MISFCEKIAIGSQFLLALLGFLIVSFNLGAVFYILFISTDLINVNLFKFIPVGAIILIAILLLWFGISYIVGLIYSELKKDNF